MDENEILSPAGGLEPAEPEHDPQEWERKRQEEREAMLAPYRATREQINEHDELMADVLYELTLMQLGEMEG